MYTYMYFHLTWVHFTEMQEYILYIYRTENKIPKNYRLRDISQQTIFFMADILRKMIPWRDLKDWIFCADLLLNT